LMPGGFLGGGVRRFRSGAGIDECGPKRA